MLQYSYRKQRISQKNDRRTIFVPSVKPSFMGPQIDESSFEETTYLEYELKKAQEQLQQIGMGAVMMTVMHFNFQFFVPLVVQIAMGPMNLFENPLFQMHILGKKIDSPWKERHERPSRNVSDKSLVDLFNDAWNTGDLSILQAAVSKCIEDDLVNQPIKIEEDLWTPLMIACGLNASDSVRELLQNGAQIDSKDKEGWNCLHWAAFHNADDAIEALLHNVSEATAKTLWDSETNEGKKSIDLAKEENSSKALVVLEEFDHREDELDKPEESKTNDIRQRKI